MSEPVTPFVRRVMLHNYKSIRKCDVTLGPLTLLVGPNGSGKSNFLDALRFVGEAVRNTLRNAVDERGGVRKILWRGGKNYGPFSIELDLELPGGGKAMYSIVVGEYQGLFEIDEEVCQVRLAEAPEEMEFEVEKGKVRRMTIPTPPPASDSQLYLTQVSGYPGFSIVHEALRGMGFYNIEPQQIRKEARAGKPARELLHSGKGALYATHRLFHNDQVKTRMLEYLQAILPTLLEVEIQTTSTEITERGGRIVPIDQDANPPRERDKLAGEPQLLKFVVRTGNVPQAFDPQDISDGTLRAFGVLLALFQCRNRPANDPIPLVGIEEPEATLHPAAAGVLFDALSEASHFVQVVATTHSAELLNIKDLDPDSLLVVDSVEGETIIGPADEVSMSAMRDRMYTAGELLEMNQLRPNPKGSNGTAAGTGDNPLPQPSSDP